MELTKEQKRLFKERDKERKRLLKAAKESSQPVSVDITKNKEVNVVCLKHGSKYGPEYVNRLYNMIQRNLTIPFKFFCLTENTNGLLPQINVLPLPTIPVEGWWYKPYVFSKDLGLTGEILFLDLDIVIIKNIDCFFNEDKTNLFIIRDFTRVNIHKWEKFNSSVFKFHSGTHANIWENFIRNPYEATRSMHGDQDWIYKQTRKHFHYWPDDWCQSYKWEVRKREEIEVKNGKRKFKNMRSPEIKEQTKILVFHGDPKPEDVEDPIIVNNWC